MNLEIGSRTDRGRRRKNNEDRLLIRRFDANGSGSAYLLAVADGMGGVPGGDLASESAIQYLEAAAGDAAGTTDPRHFLRELFSGANAEIHAYGEQNPAYSGLGTTLVSLLILHRDVWAANVGDSRAYLIRDRDIRQLTEDHSLVADQVRSGRMTGAEAMVSPRRNIITRSLGPAAAAQVDVSSVGSVAPGDTLLLCSDGLYNMLTASQIVELATSGTAQDAADSLVAAANESGGIDNIAVIVARVLE